MTPLVRLVGISKRYVDGVRERTVLRDFSLEIARGESIAVMGPSGSGKTTLLNVLAGLLVPDAGEVWYDGPEGPSNIAGLPPRERALFRRHHVGYVFQFFNLVPTLTVEENVRVPLELTRQRALEHEALARLARLGLADRTRDFPRHLSGGEQQRVAIARAVAHRPALVLADEPTGNLDADSAERVMDLLWEMVRAVPAALIVATHSERVARRADRCVRLAP